MSLPAAAAGCGDAKTAKGELMQLRELRGEVQALADVLESLWAQATGVTQHLSDMPGGGKGMDIGDVVADIVDTQREYHARLMRCLEYERMVMGRINAISDGRYRQVLMRRYVSGQGWNRIAEAMHYSRMQVTRLHGQALREYDLQHDR